MHCMMMSAFVLILEEQSIGADSLKPGFRVEPCDVPSSDRKHEFKAGRRNPLVVTFYHQSSVQ